MCPFLEQAAETVERFHLMFALQLVRCPFLNPRIRGVSILSEIIDITVRSGARCDSPALFGGSLALALSMSICIGNFAARGGLSFMEAAPADAHSGYALRAVYIHIFYRVLTLLLWYILHRRSTVTTIFTPGKLLFSGVPPFFLYRRTPGQSV